MIQLTYLCYNSYGISLSTYRCLSTEQQERRMTMTFYNKELQYRVTLNTDLNLFVVFDKEDSNRVATGVTIEQAVQELKKSA